MLIQPKDLHIVDQNQINTHDNTYIIYLYNNRNDADSTERLTHSRPKPN